MNSCRFCQTPLEVEFVDLVASPPSNSFLKKEQLNEAELYFPLRLFVCQSCHLVQIGEHKSAGEIFSSDYVYFSSYSKSWLEHCQNYSNQMTQRFKLTAQSRVVELASNDGYLLQYFKEKGMQVLGIEPTLSTAQVARQKGIETLTRFFGKDCARDVMKEKGPADLMAANNVLAHVPDINDFVSGIQILLAQTGVFTGEFPHLMQLVKHRQFDTIYHEHFSYFSLGTIEKIFRKNGLRIFDVEELPTHGGSLRIYADHGTQHDLSPRVADLLAREAEVGMNQLSYYQGFQAQTDQVKNEFLEFLLRAKREGKKVAGYGAAAKGNTLLNYCGIKKDLISFVVDASPHKQGRYLPGAHIPVVHESQIREHKPDYVVLLPWNLKNELTSQLNYIREWKGQFVIAIPRLEVF